MYSFSVDIFFIFFLVICPRIALVTNISGAWIVRMRLVRAVILRATRIKNAICGSAQSRAESKPDLAAFPV